MQTVKKKETRVSKDKTKKPKTTPSRWSTCMTVTIVAKDGEN